MAEPNRQYKTPPSSSSPTFLLKGLPSPYNQNQQDSPTNIAQQIVDVAFIATKNERFEPVPDVVRQRCIQVVSEYVNQNRPIPILIAASCCKIPNISDPLDMAEVSFLGMMMDLQKRCVTKVGYKPGFDIRVRLEDTTVLHLFCPDQKTQQTLDSITHPGSLANARPERALANENICYFSKEHQSNLFPHITRQQMIESCANYRQKFEDLVKFFNMGSFFHLLPESTLITDHQEFEKEFKIRFDLFEKLLFLPYSDVSVDPNLEKGVRGEIHAKLEQLNWHGGVSQEMRLFLFNTYSKLYPHLSEAQKYTLMARYFACIATRRHFPLGYGNDPKTWDTHGKLEISMCSPLPDTTTSSGCRVYYRSSPLLQTKEQIAFWAARGFIQTIRNIDEIKLVSNRSAISPCEKGVVQLHSVNNSVINVVAWFKS